MASEVFKNHGFKAWIWVVRAYFLLWWIQARIKWSPISWLNSKVEFSSMPATVSQTAELNLPLIMALHESVRLAARLHFISINCLPKSIVLVELLRGHGEAARVVIGIAKDQDRLASHAWVELKRGPNWVIVGEAEAISETFQKI